MSISGDGGVMVAGPVCRPSRFGLKSVADVTNQSAETFGKGTEWDEVACGYDPGIVSGQCPALPEQRKTAIRGFETKYADPFAVYAGWECSSGALDTNTAWDKAEDLLNRNFWRTMERALWTGVDQDGNPIRETFGTVEVTDLTPAAGALDITGGIATLESFAGDCFDCEPIIHANKGIATYAQERNLLETDGEMKRLKATGSRFSPGSGYGTSGPTDESDAEPTAGEAWIYVTGGITIVTGPVFFTPDRGNLAGAVDRSINDITIFAERFASIEVGCCVGAVRIILASCCCG